ncbi:hypothetical protein K438DRAFT_1750773 [Mycena galopus ATCC 62051]|nr:hypothetical protein K438DRAFT_1750773 [Mycena galopus ATCC 62051]
MPLLSDSMNVSVGNDARLRLVVGQPPPFQYLSRTHLPHGPMPTAALSPYGPVAAIVDAVSGTWQRQARREPMVLSPTFSSSPQAIYYGRTVLPDGQVLHRSAAMNTFRVFQDVETGVPVTMSGHKFIFHVACPEEPHAVWSLEAPYPTDAQMRDVMQRFVPPIVSGAVALSFPMHGTEVAPPMLTMEERLRLGAVSKKGSELKTNTYLQQGMDGSESEADVLRDELVAVGPHQLTATNLAKLPRGLAMPTPRGLMGSGQEARQVIADFEGQLHRRARKTLQLGDDYFVTYSAEEAEDASTTDADSRMPDLVSISSSGGGSNNSIDIGFCDLCLAPQHETELACPLFGTANTEGFPGRAVVMNASSDGMSNQNELRVNAVFNETLGEYEVLGTRVPEEEKRETRSALEVPDSPNEGAVFRTLVDAAVDARKMLEECTVEYNEKEDGNRTIALADADQIGSGVRIRTATPFSPPRSPLRLPPRHRTLEPEDQHSDDVLPCFAGTQARRYPMPTALRYRLSLNEDAFSPASLPGGPLRSIEDNEDLTLADRTEVIDSGEWSPVASEESVESQSLTLLRWLIEEAIFRAWGWPSSYPPSYATDSIEPSSTSSESHSGFSCTSRYEFYDDNNFELHESLSFWVRDGNEHQRDHRRFENEMGVEPLHQALQALHGPLSFFVDYLAMAGQGVKDIISTAFSPSPFSASVFPAASDLESGVTPKLTSDTPPSPTAASTSLDHSLPVTVERSPASPAPANPVMSEGEWEEIVIEPLGAGSRKRKYPDGEEEGLNQQGRRKKTPLRRIEDMVWHRYGITEYAFPDKLIRHPFLFPLEAAKLQVLWHILQRNGRDILADALHEVLSIRLHRDYAVSTRFNAAFLDDNYPERNWEYWHLLGEEHPQSIYLRNFDISDNSSDSGSMGGLEYPPSEGVTPGVTDDDAVPGHHEPCRDFNGVGPATLIITLREDTALVE